MNLDGSTHDTAIDRAAWGAITSEGQFPPLPGSFHGPKLELRLDFFVNKTAPVAHAAHPPPATAPIRNRRERRRQVRGLLLLALAIIALQPPAAPAPTASSPRRLVASLVNTPSPLIVLAGPTASGKTALALALAEQLRRRDRQLRLGRRLSRMEIGTAKPSLEERARVPHHLIDVVCPDEPCTAGDYSRLAREALAGITQRGHLPIVAGGTGLYLRALLDGLFPAPATRRSPPRTTPRRAATQRPGASAPHPHPPRSRRRRADPRQRRRPKSSAPSKSRSPRAQPMTEQWQKGRDPLTGYRVLRLGLNPPRAAALRPHQPPRRRHVRPRPGGRDRPARRELWRRLPPAQLSRLRAGRRSTARRTSPASKPSPPPSRATATTPSAS